MVAATSSATSRTHRDKDLLYFETPHGRDPLALCRSLWSATYEAFDRISLQQGLEKLFRDHDRPAVLVVRTDPVFLPRVLRAYFEGLAGDCGRSAANAELRGMVNRPSFVLLPASLVLVTAAKAQRIDDSPPWRKGMLFCPVGGSWKAKEYRVKNTSVGASTHRWPFS